MTCGIYLLEFNGTDKVYVGLSNNIERRYVDHIKALKDGKHSTKLIYAYTQYGIPKLNIILECEEHELSKAEQEAISIFDSINNGFNSISSGALGCNLYGDTNPNSKYTNEQIEQVFTYILNGITLKEIEYKTGVSLGVIGSISNCTSHTWLENKYPEQYKKLLEKKSLVKVGEAANNSKYSNDQIEAAFKLLIDPINTLQDIADKVGISVGAVKTISSGKCHRWLKDVYPNEYSKLLSLIGNRGLKREVLLTNGSVVEPVINISSFATKYKINRGNLSSVINGKRKSAGGWSLVSDV